MILIFFYYLQNAAIMVRAFKKTTANVCDLLRVQKAEAFHDAASAEEVGVRHPSA